MRSSAPAPNHRPAQSTRSPAPAAEPAPGGWLAVLTEAVLGHRRIVAAFWLVVLVAGVVSVGTITKAFSDQYGSGALSPIEILARPRNASALARGLRDVPGVAGTSAPAGAAWRRGDAAVLDVVPHSDSSSTVDAVRRGAHRPQVAHRASSSA